jgi:flagellar motor protein MotB
MASLRILSLPAIALTAALVGCDGDKTASNTLLQDNEALTKQLAEKDDKLNSMGEQLARATQQASDLQQRLAECQNGATTASAATTKAAPTVDTKAFKGIEGVEVTVEGNDIHLTIANSLLFDSGKTGLKDGARHTLDKIAQKVKELYPNREIVVVGHTDADPIRRSSYPTNYHLGFERAFAVREYLGKKGVTENHIALMSYGPDMPEPTKEKSRRVEVIVTGEESKVAAKTEAPKNAPAAAGKATAKKATAPAKAKTAPKAELVAGETAPSK